MTHLPNTCSIVSREATGYPICRGTYFRQLHAIQIFSFSSQARNLQHLLILLYALLELAKEYAEACIVLSAR